MKIEKIEIIKYIANDGTEFKTERDCLDHERKLWDALPKCKDCNGAGGKAVIGIFIPYFVMKHLHLYRVSFVYVKPSISKEQSE